MLSRKQLSKLINVEREVAIAESSIPDDIDDIDEDDPKSIFYNVIDGLKNNPSKKEKKTLIKELVTLMSDIFKEEENDDAIFA